MAGIAQTLPVPPLVNEMTMLNAIRIAAASGGGGSGTGDVVGPASSVDGQIAMFDGITGKLLKASGVQALSNTLAIPGSVSGTSTLQAPAVAGTAVVTLPSVTGTLAVIGNTVSQFAAGGALSSLTGFSLRSTGAAFDLTLASSEVLTAGRTLSFNVGNADRTLTIPATGTAALLGTANVFTAAQTITGGTVSASAPLLTTTQTWNNAGVTFVGFDNTFTKTSAATGSLMARWSTASRGSVAFEEAGEILIGAGGVAGARTGNGGIAGTSGGSLHVGCVNGGVYLGGTGTFGAEVLISGPLAKMAMRSALVFGWSSDNTSYGTMDLLLARKAAATLQLGQDAAGVTNQMFTAASRITSNGAGANLTIAAGNCRGTTGEGGVGGSLVFSTYEASVTTNTIGTLRSRMTFDTAGAVAFPVVTAVTTEVVVSDTTWPVTINGTAYKILLKA